MTRRQCKWVVGAGLVMCSFAAHAHVGLHGAEGFTVGAIHPLTGLDHLVVLLAVGLLAGQQGGRASWGLPIMFVGPMLIAAVMTTSGVVSGWVEFGLLVSVMIAGSALAVGVRGPLWVYGSVIAGFAVLHGHVHGAEAFAPGQWSYLAGLTMSSAALLGIGVAVGRIPRWRPIVRLGGAAMAISALGAAAVIV